MILAALATVPLIILYAIQNWYHIPISTQALDVANYLLGVLVLVTAGSALVDVIRRPKLNTLTRNIFYVKVPAFMNIPLQGDSQNLPPMLYAQVSVRNWGFSRAKQCRAKLAFIEKKTKMVYWNDCTWSNEKYETDIPAGLYPAELNLLKFDLISHQIFLERRQERVLTPVIPYGTYELKLNLDADGIGARTVDLGSVSYPETLLKAEVFYDYWKKFIGDKGSMLFLERTSEGKVVARTFGKVLERWERVIKMLFGEEEVEYIPV